MVSSNTESGITVTYDRWRWHIRLCNIRYIINNRQVKSLLYKCDVSITTTMNSGISALSDVGSNIRQASGQILVFDGSW